MTQDGHRAVGLLEVLDVLLGKVDFECSCNRISVNRIASQRSELTKPLPIKSSSFSKELGPDRRGHGCIAIIV